MKQRWILFLLFTLLVWPLSCDELVDGLAGEEPPEEIDDSEPPRTNPVDGQNPDPWEPEVAVTLSPDPRDNNNILNGTEITVVVEVTNLSENPDPDLYGVEYSYDLQSEYTEFINRSSDGFVEFTDRSETTFTGLDDGAYTLNLEYRIDLGGSPETFTADFTVDNVPAGSVVFLNQIEHDNSTNTYYLYLWLEEVSNVATAGIELQWPASALQGISVAPVWDLTEVQNKLFPENSLMLERGLAEHNGSLVLSISSLETPVSGSGTIAKIGFRPLPADGGTVAVSSNSSLKNGRNETIPITQFGSREISLN